jgi:phage terminase large subunit-like protein
MSKPAPNRKLTDDQLRALFAREARGERRADLAREAGVSPATLVWHARRLRLRKGDTGAPDHRRRPPGGWPLDHVRPQSPDLSEADWRAAMVDWLAGQAAAAIGARLNVTPGAVAHQTRIRGLRRKDRVDAAPAPRAARPISDDAEPFDDQPGEPHTLRPAQTPPSGDWRTWLFLGGRGAGKTLAGAEWLADQAQLLGPGGRLALIGPTLHDVREVMIEGVSGLRSLPRWTRRTRPVYQPSRRRLYFENGCVAYAFSAEDPDSLRGPQFSAAWADELCAWPAHGARGAAETLAMLRMGLRLPLAPAHSSPNGGGEPPKAVEGGRAQAASDRVASDSAPRLMVTTTPRPTRALIRLKDEATCILTRAPTAENAAHLSPGFLDNLRALYGGTRREAQELDGQIVDLDGALFTAEMMRLARLGADDAPSPTPPSPASPFPMSPSPSGLTRGPEAASRSITADWSAARRPALGSSPRVTREKGDRPQPSSSPKGDRATYERAIVAIDPPATATGDACGIIAAASRLRPDGVREAVILADRSAHGLSPDEWARRAVDLAHQVGATQLVAEVNQGGDMVASVLKAVGRPLPLREVRATRGKRLRAEPIAALYEQGRVKHAGAFDALEEELMALGSDAGEGSLDRADALVWAVTDLLVDRPGERGPRVRVG